MGEVDRGAACQSRESSRAHAECISNRGEAQNTMQIRSNPRDQELLQCLRTVRNTCCLRFVANTVEETVDFILREQIRNPSSRQNGVDVDQESIIDDLRISQQESRSEERRDGKK